ncbi:MAG TPA: acetyl-CoA hydrolase/transferase C-terminal domain-containing protein [Baekduia sp.]|nr:acetyl-CoA hydrolase/transferase C-terminal domain-containing protein [Baekduia sp.]HMJ35052.1 acetyl-CoA hydrolase/transferase C-terminal domain-containing protein [Baekduia sp.]
MEGRDGGPVVDYSYDWLDDNPSVEMLPVDEVNHPMVVAREPNFVSINATTEVDLMGQRASETIAGRPWSSSGGQADFARGAMWSPGGQGFIVLKSTTSSGRCRIRVRRASPVRRLDRVAASTESTRERSTGRGS